MRGWWRQAALALLLVASAGAADPQKWEPPEILGEGIPCTNDPNKEDGWRLLGEHFDFSEDIPDAVYQYAVNWAGPEPPGGGRGSARGWGPAMPPWPKEPLDLQSGARLLVLPDVLAEVAGEASFTVAVDVMFWDVAGRGEVLAGVSLFEDARPTFQLEGVLAAVGSHDRRTLGEDDTPEIASSLLMRGPLDGRVKPSREEAGVLLGRLPLLNWYRIVVEARQESDGWLLSARLRDLSAEESEVAERSTTMPFSRVSGRSLALCAWAESAGDKNPRVVFDRLSARPGLHGEELIKGTRAISEAWVAAFLQPELGRIDEHPEWRFHSSAAREFWAAADRKVDRARELLPLDRFLAIAGPMALQNAIVHRHWDEYNRLVADMREEGHDVDPVYTEEEFEAIGEALPRFLGDDPPRQVADAAYDCLRRLQAAEHQGAHLEPYIRFRAFMEEFRNVQYSPLYEEKARSIEAIAVDDDMLRRVQYDRLVKMRMSGSPNLADASTEFLFHHFDTAYRPLVMPIFDYAVRPGANPGIRTSGRIEDTAGRQRVSREYYIRQLLRAAYLWETGNNPGSAIRLMDELEGLRLISPEDLPELRELATRWGLVLARASEDERRIAQMEARLAEVMGISPAGAELSEPPPPPHPSEGAPASR